ncbi:MAG: hypothetical protein QME61_00525 [Patescibacteria group bacterium]|nr:hypothetical protein [Patescibacteria group bacterium]
MSGGPVVEILTKVRLGSAGAITEELAEILFEESLAQIKRDKEKWPGMKKELRG